LRAEHSDKDMTSARGAQRDFEFMQTPRNGNR
jgi:hypothetical protein